MGFSRQEYGSGLPGPSPGDLPDPGIKCGSLMTPVLAGGFFSTCACGKPEFSVTCSQRHLTEPDFEPDFSLQLYTPAHIDAIYTCTHTGVIELSALGIWTSYLHQTLPLPQTTWCPSLRITLLVSGDWTSLHLLGVRTWRKKRVSWLGLHFAYGPHKTTSRNTTWD